MAGIDDRRGQGRNAHAAARCPLCGGQGGFFFETAGRTYHQCEWCAGVFLDRACVVSPEAERRRYEEHTNDVDDPGYQQFVAPLVARVRERFTPAHRGLDYGAGTGPVAAKLLRDAGYSLELYDPYFWNNPAALRRTYDFIVCCEVMEHFTAPAAEFARLRALLAPGGALVCMTEVYTDTTDFRRWHYKNDQTHVFFYHEKSLTQIRERFGFASGEREGRVILFCAPREGAPCSGTS